MRAWLGRAYGKERGVGGQGSGLLVILTVSSELALLESVLLVARWTRPHVSLRSEHSLEGEQTLRYDECARRTEQPRIEMNLLSKQ